MVIHRLYVMHEVRPVFSAAIDGYINNSNMSANGLIVRKGKRTLTNAPNAVRQAPSSPMPKTQALLPGHLWKSSSSATLKLPSLSKTKTIAVPLVKVRPLSPKKRVSMPVPLVHHADKPCLDDFRLMRIVGTGTFSRVRIAQCRRNQEIVVVKIMRKADIVKMRQVDHVKNEKNILSTVSHPLLVNLRHSFQDRGNLYLVFDYVPGGELFRLLRTQGQFPLPTTRFYAAEVIAALAFLHEHGVVYRDLKPENMLLTGEGHIKITDFGFAKSLRLNEKTFTLCGTPEYLAPEVIQQKGHSFACDWWGVGILIYEMTCGHAPFMDQNPFKLYEKIIHNQVAFPDYFDPTLERLVVGMLDKDASTRFDKEHIMRHEVFLNMDWTVVGSGCMQPPFVPTVRAADDTSNFDDYPDDSSQENSLLVAAEVFANF